MRQDVDKLAAFYETPLGRMAAATLSERISALWPSADGRSVLGLGYPKPVLDAGALRARRAGALTLGGPGRCRWRRDPGAGNASLAGEDDRLPFPDQIFDRVVLLHALEEASAPRAVLREVWRVTAPEGRIVVVAANRRGLWARAESTPFGHGRPWTRRQLANLLNDSMFQTMAWTYALHTPPIPWSFAVSLSNVFERAGENMRSVFGGVVMVEAVKRLYIQPGGGSPEATALATAKARKGVAGAPKDEAPTSS